MDTISPHSYWMETAQEQPLYPALSEDAEADVVILGAGITGLTAAVHLQNAGQRVVILEAGQVGGGTTGGTSAHLDAQPDQNVRKLISLYGESAMREITSARMDAIGQIENWCREFQIDCEFTRIPAFDFTESKKDLAGLQKDAEALRDLKLNVEMTSHVGLPFPTVGGYRIDGQARFHPTRYIHTLAKRVQAGNGAIYEHSRAQPPQDGKRCVVESSRWKVVADKVLVCTHSAFFGISQLDARITAYQSYMLAARVQEPLPDGLFWDNAHPYHYLRRASGEDPNLILVGGCDHRTGQGDAREAMRQLEDYVRQRFTVQSVEQAWSAEYFEPADHLPYIGRVPFLENVSIATGFSGTGLTYGTVAGKLLADLVLNRGNPLEEIFTPARINPIAAAPNFITENTNTLWHFLSDRMKTGSAESLEDLKPGEGKLISEDGRQIAAYRDVNGGIHRLSPVCTHMGCHVHWNDLEKTWDCPCHGGRFSAQGERIYGPPHLDLKAIEVANNPQLG